MKVEHSRFFDDYYFKIKSHIGNYYLFINNDKIAISDNLKVLISYIDGFIEGVKKTESLYLNDLLELNKLKGGKKE